MARPRSPLPPASAILSLADGEGRIAIRVSPGASADAIALPEPGRTALTVRTTVAAEGGKANAAVIRLLAKALDRPPSALELVRGTASRDKLVRIRPLPG